MKVSTEFTAHAETVRIEVCRAGETSSMSCRLGSGKCKVQAVQYRSIVCAVPFFLIKKRKEEELCPAQHPAPQWLPCQVLKGERESGSTAREGTTLIGRGEASFRPLF